MKPQPLTKEKIELMMVGTKEGDHIKNLGNEQSFNFEDVASAVAWLKEEIENAIACCKENIKSAEAAKCQEDIDMFGSMIQAYFGDLKLIRRAFSGVVEPKQEGKE